METSCHALPFHKCHGDTFGWIEIESKVNYCCSFNALDGLLMVCCIGVNDGEVINKTFCTYVQDLGHTGGFGL